MAHATLPELLEWNQGVFNNELYRYHMYPETVGDLGESLFKPSLPQPPGSEPEAQGDKAKLQAPEDKPEPEPVPELRSIPEGTFHGTAQALLEVYSRINQRYSSFFDVSGLESIFPDAPEKDVEKNLETKRQKYQWQPIGSDPYPPHLNIIPREDAVSELQIFGLARLTDIGPLLVAILPEKFVDWLYSKPDQGNSIEDIVTHYQALRKKGGGIYNDATIGDRWDWYTDAVFAQQQFTGPNPATITLASNEWIQQFKSEAETQKSPIHAVISEAKEHSLYIQDCSYFRSAVGASGESALQYPDSPDGALYACAAVTLFQLHDDGKLHPLAIVIDYRSSIKNSVVIFNKRKTPSDPTESEATDWPWRYAKTCAQVSDWMRHEMTVHLVNTHFIEEAVIVAAERSFPTDHPILRLLHPHWLKTLSLNASARATLVPSVINKITGLASDQTASFILDAYKNFDFKGSYVPTDLNKRGFPVDKIETDPKYHNYAYGRNMILMWVTLRKFVSSALSALAPKYDENPDAVRNDDYIKQWVTEMKGPLNGNLKSFPEIQTRDELVDALTMCIHIASPQHTAVNYLQEYYQTFVLNKPSSLCARPPTTLAQLLTYNESDLVRALPINKPRVYLLAMYIPYLLNSQVAANQNIVNYAVSLAKVSKGRLNTAARTLLDDLGQLSKVFRKHNDDLDDKKVNYNVMEPDVTAVSILI